MAYTGNVFNQPPTMTTLAASGSALTRIGQAYTLYAPGVSGGGDHFSGAYVAAPSTPYCAILSISCNQGDYVAYTTTPGNSSILYGAGFYDGTKFVTLFSAWSNNTTTRTDVYEWSNSTTIASGVFTGSTTQGSPSAMVQWFMVRDDGTNIYFYIAMDGTNTAQPSQWVQIYKQGRTAYLSAPTNICWGCDTNAPSNGDPTYITLNSYQTVAL